MPSKWTLKSSLAEGEPLPSLSDTGAQSCSLSMALLGKVRLWQRRSRCQHSLARQHRYGTVPLPLPFSWWRWEPSRRKGFHCQLDWFTQLRIQTAIHNVWLLVLLFFNFIIPLPLLSPPAKFRGYLNHGGMLSATEGALAGRALPRCPYPASYRTTLWGEDPAGELVPSTTQLSNSLFRQGIFPLNMQ